jgi:hypothetical protein
MNKLENLNKILNKPIDNYILMFEELKTVKARLYYKDEWKLNPDKYDANLLQFDLMKILLNDDVAKELLEFFPKNHAFDIIFQIPEAYADRLGYELFPFIDDEKTSIKIVAEYDENDSLLTENHCFDIDKYITRIHDIVDNYQVLKILDNLDTISSGYVGIRYIDKTTKETDVIISESFQLLQYMLIFHNNEDAPNLKEILFELVKKQQLFTYLHIFPKYKDEGEFVLNVMLRKVFDFITDVTDPKLPNSAANLEKIKTFDQEIQDWVKLAFENYMDNRKISFSIWLWRTMIQLNISYDQIDSIYQNII